MLTVKTKKENEKEHLHWDVYYNGIFLGYVIKSNSLEDFNWGFVNKTNRPEFVDTSGTYTRVLNDKTKKKLLERINKIAENIYGGK